MAVRIDINLPEGWGALTQEQLRFLLKSIASATRRNRHRRFLSRTDYAVQTASVAEMLCFLEWGGLSVVCPYGDGFLFRQGKEEFVLSPDVVVSALSALEWTAVPPVEPVRLECVDGAVAIPADLSSGLPFDSWLACETIWQRYQASEDDALLQQMAAILYRKDDIRLDDAESLGVFYWWAAVKNMVASMFPHLFKKVGESDENEPLSFDEMRRTVDAQIRALTKGDITKEQEVLSLETMRALTELDAQAREYDELRKKISSK